MTKKKLILGLIYARWSKMWGATFFCQISGLSVTRYPGQLSSCTILKKLNDPILRKFLDGRTHGRIDR